MLMGKKWLEPALNKYSIQIDYTARDDNGKPFRARSTFQCEARGIIEAYKLAEGSKWFEDMKPKFGVIIPGWHIFKL